MIDEESIYNGKKLRLWNSKYRNGRELLCQRYNGFISKNTSRKWKKIREELQTTKSNRCKKNEKN